MDIDIWGAYSSVEDLKDEDYFSWMEWKSRLECIFALQDLDLALNENKPNEPTDTSSSAEKAKYDKWERSNTLILFIMKRKMCQRIYGYLSFRNKSGNAKQMFAELEKMVLERERIQAPSTLSELVGMRYNGQGNVRKHLDKMRCLAIKLAAVDVHLPEYLINQLALQSLPSQFDPIAIAYITVGKNWDWNELENRCALLEEYSMPRHENADEIGHDERKKVTCFSCGQRGHLARNCRQVSS